MKKKIVLTLLAATMIFTGCSKESENSETKTTNTPGTETTIENANENNDQTTTESNTTTTEAEDSSEAVTTTLLDPSKTDFTHLYVCYFDGTGYDAEFFTVDVADGEEIQKIIADFGHDFTSVPATKGSITDIDFGDGPCYDFILSDDNGSYPFSYRDGVLIDSEQNVYHANIDADGYWNRLSACATSECRPACEMTNSDLFEQYNDAFMSASVREDYYCSCIGTRAEVEAFAMRIKNDILTDNMDDLATLLWYPIEIDGTTYNDEDEFKSADLTGLFNDGFKKAMEAETCVDMFNTGEGCRLAEGLLWFNDYSGENKIKVIFPYSE